MEKRHHPQPELTSWPTREAMVARGLAMNMPWLAFVNISFALVIWLRNSLFDNIDAFYQVSPHASLLINIAMLGIISLSAMLIVMALRHYQGIGATLLVISAIWSVCCVWFIVYWQLPHAWPLYVILILTAIAALYYHLSGLLCYVLPLWLALPVASIMLNHGVNIRFATLWLVFTLIIIFGRILLLRWFDEAWQRNQQNQMLIARLDALAHQDALTETANRRAMESILENAVSQQKSFSLIMLDVDYFKLYNDTYGHQAGDECLARVAQALKQSVRTPDDVVSRYGGEEFVVILFECSAKMAEQVAARIQDTLRVFAIAHSASKVSNCVTVSMGIAGMTPGLSASQLIAQADAALYRAKEAGRDRWAV
ncbi:GGDEF domain-containing protein [Lelliottia amnigena]|uniref:GGDEF domain-containing protein n=1 Tax=Lelliottia amnigena TaxID=61646 RepID=UPI00293BA816|nr:membrane-associated sensor domain-containing protein [Lelliottia amnigena]